MSEQIRIREPAVSGTFYPEEISRLRESVLTMLADAQDIDTDGRSPFAIIAPHAGYIYSGPIAATAYRLLKHHADRIRHVVLLGPSHRLPFTGMALSSADFFSTPLGNIPIDKPGYDLVARQPAVLVMDAAHSQEHSLEVQLPFLQLVLDEFTLLPVVVGNVHQQEVADVIELLSQRPGTLFVISSDLSHYHDYATAQKIDRQTSDAIQNLQPELINYEMACGRNPLIGILEVARRHHLHVTTLDLRNSGDTAGSRDRVVGYGAYLIH